MPGFIGTTEMQHLIDTVTAAFDQTCKISRVAETSDGLGGRTETYTTDATTTLLIIESVKTHEAELLGARFGIGQIEYIAWFTTGSGNAFPKIGDRLVQVSDGHTYEVINVVDESPSYSPGNAYGLRRLT